MLKSWLTYPGTRGLSLDDPALTELRRDIIRGKPFLRRVYRDWYRRVAAPQPGPGEVPGAVLELGSGAGFLAEHIPGLITSEVFPCGGVRLVADAQRLPFADGALRAIVMTDVLHHVPRPQCFFAEAGRCVAPGGALVMVEPWVTAWSRLIYTRLHHEPFRPDAAEWEFPASGPLSGANGAMPWMVFCRDRARFQQQFPQWAIRRIEPFMPIRYLVSGGVSMRSLSPGFTHGLWQGLEALLRPWRHQLAMFALVVLARRQGGQGGSGH